MRTCTKCRVTDTSNLKSYWCQKCKAQYLREWRLKNPAKYKESMEKWFVSKKYQDWLERHPEYVGWRLPDYRLSTLKRDNYQCVHCGMTQEEHKKVFHCDITVDHIKGRVSNEISNLQTLCRRCHGKKDGLRNKIPSSHPRPRKKVQ